MNARGSIEKPQVTAGVYAIDPVRSTISFRMRTLFGLLPVRGTFSLDNATITVADPVEASSAKAVISATSFASGNAQRDEHVRASDYLDVENHPHVLFVSEHFTWSGDSGTLHGNLTVKDVTKQITLDVMAVSGTEHGVSARASTTIDRFAFGITTAPGLTGRKLHITLDIVATR